MQLTALLLCKQLKAGRQKDWPVFWPRLVREYCDTKQEGDRCPGRKAEARENTHNKTNHHSLSPAVKYTLDTAGEINLLGDAVWICSYNHFWVGAGKRREDKMGWHVRRERWGGISGVLYTHSHRASSRASGLCPKSRVTVDDWGDAVFISREAHQSLRDALKTLCRPIDRKPDQSFH